MSSFPEPDTDDKVTALSREIEQYLANHPMAADTVEGIIGWWLPRQRYIQARTRVQQALDRLEADGTIVKTVVPGGTVIYSLRDGELPLGH